MKRALSLLGLAIVSGLATGWFSSAGSLPQPDPRGARVAPLRHGGAAAEAARTRFLALGLGRPQVVVAEAPPPPPPPPDIEVVFRRELTAIERRPTGLLVWVVDDSQGQGRRSLKSGDIYRDGWRLASVGEQMIVLRRNGEIRTVAVFDLPLEPTP